MTEVLAAAEAATFSESEISALADMALASAVRAIAEGRFYVALGCVKDAGGHINALIERRRSGRG